LLLSLYHLLCFFLPKPQDSSSSLAWQRAVKLFFPGSPAYSQGWGLAVLLVLVWGLWLWQQGNSWGIALSSIALGLHLFLWALLFPRNR
jgi:hypothetical protein